MKFMFHRKLQRRTLYSFGFWGALLVVAVVVAMLPRDLPWLDNDRTPDSTQDNSKSCAIALQRAKAYGVLPPDSELANRAPSTERGAKNTVCGATSGEHAYAIEIAFTCKDKDRDECLTLMSVNDVKGDDLFHRLR